MTVNVSQQPTNRSGIGLYLSDWQSVRGQQLGSMWASQRWAVWTGAALHAYSLPPSSPTPTQQRCAPTTYHVLRGCRWPAWTSRVTDLRLALIVVASHAWRQWTTDKDGCADGFQSFYLGSTCYLVLLMPLALALHVDGQLSRRQLTFRVRTSYSPIGAPWWWDAYSDDIWWPQGGKLGGLHCSDARWCFRRDTTYISGVYENKRNNEVNFF